jgi:hypothetical protein
MRGCQSERHSLLLEEPKECRSLRVGSYHLSIYFANLCLSSAVNAARVSGTANAATPTSNAYFLCTSPIICPAQDGCSWNSPNGRYMTIRCNRDFYGGDSISQTVAGYYECVGLCLNSDGPCQAVSFAQFDDGTGAGRCYLKNALKSAVYDSHIHGTLSTIRRSAPSKL